jgi:hypothetical protein
MIDKKAKTTLGFRSHARGFFAQFQDLIWPVELGEVLKRPL